MSNMMSLDIVRDISATQVDDSYVFLAFIWIIVVIIGRWLIYKKAGRSGIGSIIPVYSDIVMCRIIGLNPWLLLLLLVPFVNVIFAIYYSVIQSIRLAKNFGKGILYILGLFFFNPLFIVILGFGSSEYSQKY